MGLEPWVTLETIAFIDDLVFPLERIVFCWRHTTVLVWTHFFFRRRAQVYMERFTESKGFLESK